MKQTTKSVKFFLKTIKRFKVHLCAIFIWIILSFIISVLATNLILDILKYFEIEIFNQEAISNIFAVWFTILVGIGSIVISLLIHLEDKEERQQDKNIVNFPALEILTVEEYFLNGNKGLAIFKDGENRIGESFWFTKNGCSKEFILIEKSHKLLSFVHNIFRNEKKEDPLLFVLVNRGNITVIPESMQILYKKKELYKKRDAVGFKKKDSKYLQLDGYYIEESLDHTGVLGTKEDHIFIWATESKYEPIEGEKCASAEEYEDFYNTIKETKEFFVILNFRVINKPNKPISRAFRASIDIKKYNGIDVGYIKACRPYLTKNNLSDFFGSKFTEEILTVSNQYRNVLLLPK